MRYFPLFIDTHGLNVSVFGGGLVAESKVKLLLKSEAQVTVFSSQLTPLLSELHELGSLQQIPIAAGELTSAEIEWARVRVAYDALEAPEEIELARQWIRDRCAEHNVLLNVVDQRALCQFITPALVDRDPITVAISTSGAAPMLGRLIRAQVEELLSEYIGELARWSEGHRPQVGETLPPGSSRRDFWAELFDVERPIGRRIVDALRAGDEPSATRELYALLTEHQQRLSPQLGVDSSTLQSVEASTHSTHSARGELYLVGAGPGDPDLITVRAAQTIGRADVIVTDRLVNPLIIERYARREAEVIYVGKDPRGRSTSQDEINQILVELAETSQVIVRLKGGDPMIFGRAVEELTALREAGFECEIIPGVSAAVAGAASLQLPLTQRQVHRQCVLATAMSCDGPVEHPWVELARSGSLLALYMSSRLASRVESRLLEAGLDPDTPVTVAASISTPQQAALWGSLRELSALAQALSPHPMILYIGAHPLHSLRSYDVDRSLPSMDPLRVTPAHRTTPLPLDRSTGGAAPVAWTCQPSDPDQRRRA